MDDIPKARGTKPSSTAAASRYAFEASGVRFVRRIHSSDSRKVSSERFIEPPGIRAPMTRFTTDIQMRFRDIDGMGHVNNAVYLSYTELASTQCYITQARKKASEDIDFILSHVHFDCESQAVWRD